MQRWTKLYQEAMAESNATKLPLLLEDAMDAVLEEIEDDYSRPNGQRRDLTRALNDLRSRRKEVESLEIHRVDSSGKAA